MSTTPIDYAALAKQAGAIDSQPAPSQTAPASSPVSSAAPIDYAALAKQTGAIDSQPAPQTAPPTQEEPQSDISKVWEGIKRSMPAQTVKQIWDAVQPPQDAREHALAMIGGTQSLAAYRVAKQLVDSAEATFKAPAKSFQQAKEDFVRGVLDFHNKDYRNSLSDAASVTGDMINVVQPGLGLGTRVRDLSEGARPGGNLVTPITQDIIDAAALRGGEEGPEDLQSIKEGVRPVADITSRAAGKASELAKTAGEGAAGRAETLLTRVQKPTMGDINYAARQKAALPDLAEAARTAEKAGTPVTTPREAVAAINNRIGDIEDAIREPLKHETISAETFQPRVILQTLDNLKETFESDENAGRFPSEDAIKATNGIIERLEEINTVPKLENFRKQLNEESNWGAFHVGPTPEVLAARSAASGIRDALYGTDEEPGIYEKAGLQGDVRLARRRVGNLIEVRDNLERAINRAEQTGDWSPVANALSWKGLMTAGIGTGIGTALGGGIPGAIAGEALTQAHSFLTSKNPNLNTKWAFKHLAGSDLNAPENPTYAPGQTPPSSPSGNPALKPISPSGGEPSTAEADDKTTPSDFDHVFNPDTGKIEKK